MMISSVISSVIETIISINHIDYNIDYHIDYRIKRIVTNISDNLRIIRDPTAKTIQLNELPEKLVHNVMKHCHKGDNCYIDTMSHIYIECLREVRILAALNIKNHME